MNKKKKPEILAPAGDMQRLDTAITYGADAVYLAATEFGMRTAPSNFDNIQLKQAVKKAHENNVKVYLTCNITPRMEDLDTLPESLAYWQEIGIDALIIGDIGVLMLAKEYAPNCDIHMSTQAGVTNHHTAKTLYDMGVTRVVLARELSLQEIAHLKSNAPPQLEIECFVHGAMCMAFSGRCLISSFMTGREGNRGDCAQPCRWEYQPMKLEYSEKKREGQVFEVIENEKGSFIYNANDLNMVEHISDLYYAGIDSFKIEGRAKAQYYVAATTNAYRCAVDEFEKSEFNKEYKPKQWIVDELQKISHRPYGTGFYYGQPSQDVKVGNYVRDYKICAVVEGYDKGRLYLSQRNKFNEGDTLEVLAPRIQPFTIKVVDLQNEDGQPINSTPHPLMKVSVKSDKQVPKDSFLRIKK